jgi:prepilin-type N-terminal cleavage/methylation domain-containing protein
MRKSQRKALTLMELLIVLAILVIVAAIAIPVMSSMMTDTNTSVAGDQLRGLLAEARARAMEEGRPWRVGYLANTGTVQIAPEESSEWENAATGEIEKIDLIRQELPKDIIIALTQDDIASRQDAGAPGSGWETIAVFLPFGNARDDGITYFGQAGYMPMRIVLRGLTGNVSIEMYDSSSQP